jgi:CYTH domain-containing protein
MAREIERKFLVKGYEWRENNSPVHTCQGYLSTGSDCTVRVRVMGDQAFLTVKGKPNGLSRLEYEYEIPVVDAEEILDRLCVQPHIEKNRYQIYYAGIKWEIDEFLKDNEGLIVAEVELESEGQKVELPPWVGEEVSHDPRYSNSNLARNPYRLWRKGARG